MGLDGVELVMEVEETFGLSISDLEAERSRTVGDLHALIVRKLGEREGMRAREGICPSASAFYALRRGAVASLGVDRAAVHPAGSIATLMGPYLGRRERWSQLETAAGLRLPALQLAGWMVYAIVAISLATGPLVGWWTYRVSGEIQGAIASGVLLPICLLFMLGMAARPFARHLPASYGTVRGLIGDVVSRNLGALTVRLGRPPTEDEVFDALRTLISELLDVEPEEITPEARFVEDLGLG